MSKVKAIADRIVTVKSTEQITQAMKMVAAAKLAKAQNRTKFLVPYTQKLLTMVHRVVHDLTDGDPAKPIPHPYAVTRELNTLLVIVVGSDRGLCGAFNTNLCKRAMQYIRAIGMPRKQLRVMPIGKKVSEYFQRQEFILDTRFVNLVHHFDAEQVDGAAQSIIDGFVHTAYDAVRIVYTELEGTATQVVKTAPFLPLPAIPKPANVKKRRYYHYVYDPGKKRILAELLPTLLSISFHRCLLASQTAEHSARMLAMSKASDNARELLKQLRLDYNRTRQAIITKEILEIAAGAEAMGSGH